MAKSSDIIKKDLIIDNTKVKLIYNETITDSFTIEQFILNTLFNLNKKQLKNLNNYIPNTNSINITNKEIDYYLYNSFIIIKTKWNTYAYEVRSPLSRGIPTIDGEVSITGPKDAFIENYNINIGLLRRRIPNKRLIIETMNIGRLTNTKIGLSYIEGITNKKLIDNIKNKLKRMDIDGICDSSYIKRSLEDKKQLFPTIIPTERPDKATQALLEGKVIIIVENSPYVLILPSFFIDFFHTVDDYYSKSIHTSFIRIIRIFALLIAILTPGIYIAITTRNYNLVPLDLLIVLKAGRTFVPFPAYLEAIFMIICFEILKESDLRMSSTNGSAVSILGGLILGDAAVSAGIVSPIMIIVIAISSIAGLTFANYEFVNVLRFYKVIILLLSTLLGIIGTLIGLLFLIINLIKTKCFNYKYLTPFIPFDKNEIKDSFIKVDNDKLYRNSILTNNKYRGNIR